jgi:hypothetical protein
MHLKPIIIGDTTVYKFAIYDACGINLIDLRPWVIVMTIKRSNQDPDEAAIWQGSTQDSSIVIDDQTDTTHPGQGLGYCEATVPDTASLQLRQGVRFYFDVQLSDEAQNSYTPLHGTFYALGQTTQTVPVYGT